MRLRGDILHMVRSTTDEGPGRRIWQTSTALFEVCATSEKPSNRVIDSRAWPYYEQAFAQGLVSDYLHNYFPYEDFVKIGAGNGTLAMDILDFIRSGISRGLRAYLLQHRGD